MEITLSNIATAGAAIRSGELIGLPTETVYGLAADATNEAAVLKIYETKRRPKINPLIVHITNIAEAKKIAKFNMLAEKLANAWWPGPLTLVLPMLNNSSIADVVVNGQQTIALRIPAHPVAYKVIEAADRPIAAPSANISGHISATNAEHVLADFGNNVPFVLDAGPSDHGLESTIIDTTDNIATILRHGHITLDDIKSLNCRTKNHANKFSTKPNAPGQLLSHYSPHSKVRLNVLRPNSGEAFIAFGSNVPSHSGPFTNISRSGDLLEAAFNLFTALRHLDSSFPKSIAVMPIPNHGIGIAINDRLNRAAAPRR
ncbi:MAG: threonylcarbamoyl-AMP synthase [Hyphomicrobiaceae bacterium]|nr:threonylcarbamoyl-AMP synthase [Hyphomicrobiaceae bacterium]